MAKIIGSKIYINRTCSGIQISDILKVITESGVYDPETGALIGVSKGEIKGTVEIVIILVRMVRLPYFILVQVNEGDFVQLY